MRALIVENEIAASNLLANILSEYCSDIKIEGVAKTITQGIHLISKLKPEIVFLDIELDDGESFEILDKIENRDFKVIFTTAYDQHALKAFGYEAIDYLLKPYCPSSVSKAVLRVQKLEQNHRVFKKLNDMLDLNNLQSDTISVPHADGLTIIEINNIARCEAQQSYCDIHTKDGQKIILSKPLANIERRLDMNKFVRCHASHLVCKDYIKELSTKDGGYILLKNGDQVPVSRRRKQEILERLQ